MIARSWIVELRGIRLTARATMVWMLLLPGSIASGTEMGRTESIALKVLDSITVPLLLV